MKRAAFHTLMLILAGPVMGQIVTPPAGVLDEDLGSMAYEAKEDYIDRRESVDPVFLIPNPLSALFTDFELKGSTNNFASMQFFFHSPNPDASAVTAQVWPAPPDVFYTDSRHADRRRWIRLPADQPDGIALRLAGIDSVIGGWLVIVRGFGRTRSEWEAFVWAYVFMDAIGYPDGDPGGRSVWRPIRPVHYVGEGTSPLP